MRIAAVSEFLTGSNYKGNITRFRRLLSPKNINVITRGPIGFYIPCGFTRVRGDIDPAHQPTPWETLINSRGVRTFRKWVRVEDLGVRGAAKMRCCGCSFATFLFYLYIRCWLAASGRFYHVGFSLGIALQLQKESN